MKKIPIALAGAAVCAALLAGCSGAETPDPAISSDSTTITSQIQEHAAEIVESANTVPDDTQSGSRIGEARAVEIAKAAAGVTDAEVTENRLETDDGVSVYHVDLVSGNTNYEFEIDAAADTVLEQSQEPVTTGDTGSGISSAEAEKIARQAMDITGGTVVKNQPETDDGRQIYEIEIMKDGVEYSCEIDAATGTVLEQSREMQD